MTKAKKKTSAKTESSYIIPGNGLAVDGNVVVGEDNGLTMKEQGQLARGEIDESGKSTGKETVKRGENTIKTGETLYQGDLTAECVSNKTGEKVLWKWHQAMPTTEEGCYRVMESAHGVGSLYRDKFKLDPTNSADPTLRTSLERP